MIYLRFKIRGEEKYGVSVNRNTVIEIKPDYFSTFKSTCTLYFYGFVTIQKVIVVKKTLLI